MTHQAPGGSAALRCTLDYPDLDAFVRGYGRNLSAGGLFLPTKEPPSVGTLLRFELRLRKGESILRGEGTVTQKLAEGGVAVRLLRIDAAGRALLDKALAYKSAHSELYFEPPVDRFLAPLPTPTVAASQGSHAAHTSPAPSSAEPAPSSSSSVPKAASSGSVPPPRAKGEDALAGLLSPAPAAQSQSSDDVSKLLEARLSRRRTT